MQDPGGEVDHLGAYAVAIEVEADDVERSRQHLPPHLRCTEPLRTELALLDGRGVIVATVQQQRGGAHVREQVEHLVLQRDELAQRRVREPAQARAAVDLTLHAETSRVFSVLPAPVNGVATSGAPSSKRGSDATFRFEVRVASGRPGPRVLHAAVAAPDGTPRRAYSKDVITSDGAGTFTIPFALNDPLGNYTVELTDVMSGVSTVSHVALAE